jgi:hypothetical protein
VSLTYERPSTRALNGPFPTPATSEFSAPFGPATPAVGYTGAELAARTGVPPAALAALPQPRELYAAIDVVRLAVVDRLVRSGVPVARAAALVQAAENLANTAI